MAERRFVVEGPQAVREALDALLELYVDRPRATRWPRPLGSAASRSCSSTDGCWRALAETVTPQGLVGVAAAARRAARPGCPPWQPAGGRAARRSPTPATPGTVIRTADAAGADAVVLTEGSVDPHNGKCVRASAGSLWHLPVVTGPSAHETLALLRRTGLQVLATTGARHATTSTTWLTRGCSQPDRLGLRQRGARACRAEVLDAADRTVRIPIRGRAESLNLATAAAVCLYASARAQRALQ